MDLNIGTQKEILTIKAEFQVVIDLPSIVELVKQHPEFVLEDLDLDNMHINHIEIIDSELVDGSMTTEQCIEMLESRNPKL